MAFKDIILAVTMAVKKAKAYTDSKTSGIGGGVNYKGSVNYYSNLPANPEEGDAYTVKYAGSSGAVVDGTEYVWGLNTDTNTMEWIEWSKDCYTKAEADSLLNGKQAQLTTEQLAAVNSGITTEEVEQIDTNKNNVVFVSQNGAANYAKVGTNSYANYGLTITVSNGEVTISGTANGTFSLYIGGEITDTNTGDIELTSKLPDVIAFTGAPDTDNKNRMIFALYNGSTWVYSGSTNDLYHDLTGKVYTHWLLYIPIVSGNQYNGVWKPMIVPKSLYDSGFTTYEPYAMSNTELTAKEQANENNILTLQQQVGYANTELEGVL